MRLRYGLSALASAVAAAGALGVTAGGAEAVTAARMPAEHAGAPGGEIIYLAPAPPGHIYPRMYAIRPDGAGKHLLYSLGTEDDAFSAARDTGELLYLKSTGNGDPATLVERYADGKIAHTIRFFPKGGFSISSGGLGIIALSANGATAAIVSYSPNFNDPSLFVIQTATGKILAEPIRATRSGKRAVTAVSWGPASGELTVLDENPVSGRFEVQVLKLDGSVVRTYAVPGNENGYYQVAPGPGQVLYTGTSARYSTNDVIWRQPLAGGAPSKVNIGIPSGPSPSPVIDEPWSPTYTNIVLSIGAPANPGAIFIASANGSSPHRVPNAYGSNAMWVSSLSTGG